MHWREHVATALDGRHPGLGHYIELFLDAVIILSTVALGVETVPDLPAWAVEALYAFEICVIAVFTIEYVLRLLCTPHPFFYARSFFGIVDLLAIAPFYIALLATGGAIDLRAIRALRLLRLARLFKLARYTVALDRFGVAWRAVKDEVTVFMLFVALGIIAVPTGLVASALVAIRNREDAQEEREKAEAATRKKAARKETGERATRRRSPVRKAPS
jgi:voltage-gated potassium channel